MRITIITFGSRGDVQPYIALGAGLRASGHDVRLATSASFETVIRYHGLDFSPVEGDPRKVLESREGLSWLESGSNPLRFIRRMSRIFNPLMEQGLADSWRACQDADTVIFSALGWIAGQQIADKLGIPFFPAYLQPMTPTSAFPSVSFPVGVSMGRAYNRLTYAIGEEILWRLFRRSVNEARRKVLDLPPMPFRSPLGKAHRERRPTLYGYSPSVLPKPPDWGEWLHVTGYWFLDRPADWEPPADLVDFLRSGPAPVYIGFGSMNSRNPEETTEVVLGALARSGQRGVLSTGWGGMSDADLPDGALRMESVPHDWLFPQMAAAVHHGGAGTTAASLRAGVPTIVVPFFGDQPFWAHRVYGLGAGPRPIPRKRLSVERLADAISAAVSDEGMRERAATLGRRIRAEDGVARAVEVINRSPSVEFSRRS